MKEPCLQESCAVAALPFYLYLQHARLRELLRRKELIMRTILGTMFINFLQAAVLIFGLVFLCF